MPDTDPSTPSDPGVTRPEDERVEALLEHSIDVPVLAEAVEAQEAADAADTLERIADAETLDVLEAMGNAAAAEALAEMEAPLAVGVLEDLLDEDKVDYAGALLSVMAPDDAADLLQAVAAPSRDDLLRAMVPADAAVIRRLLGYAEDTAGGLMTTDFLALAQGMTVGEATEAIRARSFPDSLQHLPVVDGAGRLVGQTGFRDLLLSATNRKVDDLLDPTARAVRVDADQEEVARAFDRYDLAELPVVDDQRKLLGIVTVDDVIDIIRAEQTEDVQKTVGAGGGEAVYSPLRVKFTGRFPWLATSLFMTCGAAAVVLFFEELVRSQPIVAFLMPVIAALVGNAGHQALAVTLRGIVLEEVRPERVLPLVAREAAVGVLNGGALGALMFLVVLGLSFVIESASWRVGAVAGGALAVSMCAGTLTGSAVPLVMRRFGFDPAQSSAIFLIMITDAVAFATFLGMARVAF